jgi:hypothetical protein
MSGTTYNEWGVPSIGSLVTWNVGVTVHGLVEIRLTLSEAEEARAWALWLSSMEHQPAIEDAAS